MTGLTDWQPYTTENTKRIQAPDKQRVYQNITMPGTEPERYSRRDAECGIKEQP